MKYGLYAIRDRLVGFLSPVCEQNDNVAIRNFMVAINETSGLMKSKPSDFDFYRIGVYDTEDGVCESDAGCPEFLCAGASVVEVKNDEK